ncbi:MAG: S-layer homology domain-containing protein, partial [Clostridia bacterium]|nr:S-layer homology domain-containing protein [Clostridia bacterium]
KLRTATVIDRVVVYYGYTSNAANDVRFYLANVSPTTGKLADGKSYAYPANFKEEDTDNVKYLGYRGDAESYVSFTDVVGVGGRIVFDPNSDKAFSHVVAAYGFNTTGGYIKEMQAYKKVTDTKSVSSNRPAQVIYKQNGPEFTVTANGLNGSEGDSFTLTAMAFDSNDARISKKESSAILSGGVVTAGINFEENGVEADASISKVVLSLKNHTEIAVTEDVVFNITPQEESDGIYNSFTNGFYEALTDYSTQEYMYWVKSDDSENHPDGIYNANGTNTTGTTDYKVATDYEKPTFAANSSYMGFYSNKLRTATVIDRVVAYYGYTNIAANDVRFYLANVSPTTAKLADGKSYAYPANFKEEDTDNVEYLGYRGDAESYVSFTDVTGVGGRIVFDPNSDKAFSHIVAAYGFNTTGGYIKEMQAYKKVVDTKTIILENSGDGGEGEEGGEGGEIMPTASPTPTAPPAGPAIPTGTNNVAVGATAFAYGSIDGTAPYMAVDGDASTYWMSANNGKDKDYLILDLGAAYMIDALSLDLAEGSGQNFKLYGSNSSVWIEKEGETPIRTALTGNLNDLVAGQDKIITTGIPGERYRYIIVEQAEEATATPFGFNEIGVYTYDAPQGNIGVGKIQKLSYKKGAPIAFASNRTTVSDSATYLNKLNSAEYSPADANPGTYFADLNFAWQIIGNDKPTDQWGNGIIYLIDLGLAQKLTHVAFQTKTHISYWDQATDFMIIGTNELPSKDNDFAESGKYDVLAELNGKRVMESVENGNARDTGLQVFDVKAQYQETPYRYIGLFKNNPSANAVLNNDQTAIMMRLAIGTLQAYGNTDTLSAIVDSQDAKKIIDEETSTVNDTEITYSASFWNGSESGNLVAALTQYDENGTVLVKHYVDCGTLNEGMYHEILIEKTGLTNATEGYWELVILNGLKVYDYISDLEQLTRPAVYAGSASGTTNLKRVGYQVSASGTVDGGIVGMVVLKPGVNTSSFFAADIYDLVLSIVSSDVSSARKYDLRYVLPADAPGTAGVDAYTVNLISNSGALTNESLSIPLFTISDIVSDFQSVTSETVVGKINDNSTFFDTDITTDVASATNFGTHFMMAKEGLTGGAFDDAQPGWSDINTITAAIQAAILIDATLTGTDVEETIAKYGTALPAIFDNPDYDGAEFETILPSVKANSTLDTAEALANAYRRTIGLSLLANGELSDRIKAIDEYSSALGISDETMNTSQETLSIAKKLSKDMQVVTSSYAGGMDAIVAGIIAELDAADAVVDSVILGNATIGGGSSNVKVSGGSAVQIPVASENNQQGTENAVSAIRKETGFADIDNHGWAHDAIKVMKNRGIISGVEANSFAPDALLTRGQTAKLLVLTMNLTTTSEDNGYRDCDHGSWYYPFVTAAKAHGLVNGISRTEFGVSANITRQDLAVMIYRAMENKGLLDEVVSKSFSDDAAVSGYAKEAVATLSGMGVIQGFEDGTFGPDKPATRAQAAVIFARFLNIIETADKEG